MYHLWGALTWEPSSKPLSWISTSSPLSKSHFMYAFVFMPASISATPPILLICVFLVYFIHFIKPSGVHEKT